MPEQHLRAYQNALAELCAAETAAEAVVARVRELWEAAGLPTGVLNAWRKLVPVNSGEPCDDAAWLGSSYHRVDVTGRPMAQELTAALGRFHRATIRRVDLWRALDPFEKQVTPPEQWPPT
jgi:hypothetical protein